MAQCELDVGDPRGRQDRPEVRIPNPLARRCKPVRKLIEALTHQLRQDSLPVGEVVVGRLVGAPGTPSHLPHAQRTRTRLVQKRPTGSQQLGAQVSAAPPGRSQ